MSSQLSIPRSAFKGSRSSRSNSISSSSSSSSSSSRSTKYVPLHKRAGSDKSSVASSSRPSSPVSTRSVSPVSTPGVYSFDALFALRPLADEGMKQKMRDNCPEVTMNRRMRKSLQYIALNPHLRTSLPQIDQLDPHEEEEAVPEPAPSATTAPSQQQQQQRALPRRNRPARRPLERRRSALQETWKGVRVASVQSVAVV